MNRFLPLAPLAFLSACATVPQPVVQPPLAKTQDVQIIAINDFHGNLETPSAAVERADADGTIRKERLGGAAALAATIRGLRGATPSITVSAGDLIGASPLTSAYFLDEPTIAAMNLVGLDLNAVGNHEFDKGAAELKRMQEGGCAVLTSRKPCAVEPFKGASFRFLAANVRTAEGKTLFPAAALRDLGGIKVGFVGMTLKDTKTLVTPAGVAGLTFDDEVQAANAAAADLKALGADTLVLLIHQGGKTKPTFNVAGCPGMEGAILPILDGIDPAYSVVISGHTHYAYACERKSPTGTDRLLTSAGKFGYFVTDVHLTFDRASRRVISARAANKPVDAAPDAAVKALVDRYAAAAAPAAAKVVGTLAGAARTSDHDDESAVANLIADAQYDWARIRGGAQMAFINGGGVRTELAPGSSGQVTYGQIFQLQPFGNGVVVLTLTGAQLRRVLEQQFDDASYAPDARPSLLIPSNNVRFDYDLSRPSGQRIVRVTVDGKLLREGAGYRVAVNNFLASGGDGYSVLAEGANPTDTGTDIDALGAWLAKGQKVPDVGRTRNVTPR